MSALPAPDTSCIPPSIMNNSKQKQNLPHTPPRSGVALEVYFHLLHSLDKLKFWYSPRQPPARIVVIGTVIWTDVEVSSHMVTSYLNWRENLAQVLNLWPTNNFYSPSLSSLCHDPLKALKGEEVFIFSITDGWLLSKRYPCQKKNPKALENINNSLIA